MVRDVALLLDRHQQQRANGVPVVSLLVGSFAAAHRQGREWASTQQRACVLVTTNNFPVIEWLQALSQKISLREAALIALARRSGRDPEALQTSWTTMTLGDQSQFFASLTPHADDALLRQIVCVPCVEMTRFTEADLLPLLRLTPPAYWPCLLWVTRTLAELSYAAQQLSVWALREPGLPIVMNTPTNVWAEFHTTPDSRAKALVRDGLIELEEVDLVAAQKTLQAAGLSATSAALVAKEADAELVASAVATQQLLNQVPTSENDDTARSAAERWLFDYLEGFPPTAGHFVLNHELDFRFGRKRAEIDLFCARAKLAIEIDGYFHFQKADSYRRDRRKDWEMQKRGYRVLRFLAEDVVDDIEIIRDRICDALQSTGEPSL